MLFEIRGTDDIHGIRFETEFSNMKWISPRGSYCKES